MKGDKIKKWQQMYVVAKSSILYYYPNNAVLFLFINFFNRQKNQKVLLV